MKKSVLALAVATLLSACAGQQIKEAPPAPVAEKKPAAAASVTPEQAKSATAGQKSVAIDPLKDPAGVLSRRNVYFDYDEYLVKADYKPVVEAHARYLVQNKGKTLKIEGNTDERGSREYNLALGQKRADSVRKVMQVLGVADQQIETVSFGEEKPRATCNDESCWKENRRADIVYKGE